MDTDVRVGVVYERKGRRLLVWDVATWGGTTHVATMPVVRGEGLDTWHFTPRAGSFMADVFGPEPHVITAPPGWCVGRGRISDHLAVNFVLAFKPVEGQEA